MAFISNAFAIGLATGLNSKINSVTFTYSAESLLSAGFATASASAHALPPMTPPPSAVVAVHASAVGGNLNIGWDYELAGSNGTSVFGTAATYASSLSLLGSSPWTTDAFSVTSMQPGVA